MRDITPNGFILTGECNMCGMCCIEAWRFNAMVDKGVDSGGRPTLEVLEYAQEPIDAKVELSNECIEGDNPGCIGYVDGLCIQHGPDKRFICSGYPHLPEQDVIFPKCGYTLRHTFDMNWKD